MGDIVLLMEAAAEQNSWPMAKIVATNADKKWISQKCQTHAWYIRYN